MKSQHDNYLENRKKIKLKHARNIQLINCTKFRNKCKDVFAPVFFYQGIIFIAFTYLWKVQKTFSLDMKDPS